MRASTRLLWLWLIALVVSILTQAGSSAAPATAGLTYYDTRINSYGSISVDAPRDSETALTCGRSAVSSDGLEAETVFESSCGKATNAGDDLTRVGRWMGNDELFKMKRSGQVQVGGGGTTHVADPANMATYAKQAAPGSKYVEFDVPRTSLFPSGWPGGAQIPGPNHILARLAERRGSPVHYPVPACSIVVVGSC